MLSFRIKKKISELLIEDSPIPLLPLNIEPVDLSSTTEKATPPIENSIPASLPSSSIKSSRANAPTSGKKEEDSLPKSFKSLKTVSLRKKAEESVADTSAKKEAEVIQINQPFTKEALHLAWNIYVESILEDPHLLNAMKAYPPELLDDYIIEVVVQNQPLLNKIQEIKPSLERHLQHQLKNNRIRMSIRISEVTENKRPYTAKDKLDYLIQKNPNLEVMYRALGLEL